MTEILRSPPPQCPSTSRSNSCIRTPLNIGGHNFLNQDEPIIINSNPAAALYRSRNCREIREEVEGGDEVSVLAFFVTIFRSSLVGCRSNTRAGGVEEQLQEEVMEIGSPTNVRHVAHVTFDRFNGFLGLPVEFEPEVPRRPPSASTRVFGVSTESMQLSFDGRGNCVPTILLMMQRRLYSQRGVESEGIFRINPENGQEEYVREQLNNGLIPDDIDVHCLAGLIKAWFRELPRGVLDTLSPEQVMRAQSEDECVQLVRLLPPTEAALLDWAINLMADVAQLEHLNKMNARNIAMVFAPNMTQMSDPLTALMYAVQVMNFLKTLIIKTLREREDSVVEASPMMQLEPSDDDHHHTILKPEVEVYEEHEEEESNQADSKTGDRTHGFLSSIVNSSTDGEGHEAGNCPADILHSGGSIKDIFEGGSTSVGSGRNQSRIRRTKTGQPRNSNCVKKGSKKHASRPEIHYIDAVVENNREASIVRRVNSYTEPRAGAWR